MLLKGKVAVVTGGTRGIGRAVVEKYLENGAKVVLWGSREETVKKALAELKSKNGDWDVSGMYGIGRAVVEKYLENGAKVVLWGSREETVKKALAELKSKNGDWDVSGMYPDLTNASEVETAIQSVKEQYGKIDILVNNAGISQSTPLYQYTADDFDKIMKLNVSALFYTILPTAKIMKEQGGGVIINTSSMVSISGQPSGVGYPTSKFAVNGMTVSLARELAKDHIRVNAVAPGVTKTDMVAALPEAVVAAISAKIPLGRPGEPEDVANAFVYLASDMASYVTGEILSVDGACRA